jgi:hypothetical protein
VILSSWLGSAPDEIWDQWDFGYYHEIAEFRYSDGSLMFIAVSMVDSLGCSISEIILLPGLSSLASLVFRSHPRTRPD